MLNVEDFGAVGDGVAKDTAAVQRGGNVPLRGGRLSRFALSSLRDEF